MSPEKAKIVSDFLCKNLENEYKTTRRVLAALPDNQMEWQPHEKGFKAGDLAWHIVGADCFFLTGIADGAYGAPAKIERPKTVAEIVAFYDQHFPPLLERVQSLSGEQMAKPLTFAIFNNPAVIFLNLASHHSVHHRGQLSAYLRAMGAKVPSIYGPSADEK